MGARNFWWPEGWCGPKGGVARRVVGHGNPFDIVDNIAFRKLMEYFNSAVRIRRAIPTGLIIRYAIREQYDKHQRTVIDLLCESSGKIHISFDGWTSPNQTALYGIVCFFRNKQNQPQKLLLGVSQAFRHFGSIIAAEVLDVIEAFGIKKKVGYFTLDNAENNTTAVEVIGGELGFDGRRRRGRCIGHIINLAAKALLFGKHADAFEEQFDGRSPLTTIEYQYWQAKGPVENCIIWWWMYVMCTNYPFSSRGFNRGTGHRKDHFG
jgi:hypothetical protein